jgi:hypothetical protein
VGENIRTGFKIGFGVVELTGSALGSVMILNEQGDGPSGSKQQGIFLTS